MEKEIQEMVDELNKLNSSQYSNLYEFILYNSSIKKEKSDITEDEIRKIPSIKLKELLVEMELKIKSLKKNISNEEQIKSLEKVLEIGIDIFSSDENRKLYEKMEQSRTVLSADSISSFKKSDFEKYQKYIDDNKKETFEKAKPVTREDLIKFLKEARKDYTDEELEFVKNKFNELSEEKISPKL
jgi:hypothetical protein